LTIKQLIAALRLPNLESEILQQQETGQENVICIDLERNNGGQTVHGEDGAPPSSAVDVPGPSCEKLNRGKNEVSAVEKGTIEAAAAERRCIDQREDQTLDKEVEDDRDIVQEAPISENVPEIPREHSKTKEAEMERSPITRVENSVPSPKVVTTASPILSDIGATQPIIVDGPDEIRSHQGMHPTPVPVGLETVKINAMKRQSIGTIAENTLQKKMKDGHVDQSEKGLPKTQPQRELEASQTLGMRAPLTQDDNAFETQAEPDLVVEIPVSQEGVNHEARDDATLTQGTIKDSAVLQKGPKKTDKGVMTRPVIKPIPIPSPIHLIRTLSKGIEKGRKEKAPVVLSTRTLAARKKFQELQSKRREAIQAAAAASTFEEPAIAQASRYPPHLTTSIGRMTEGGLGTQSVQTPSVHANVCIGAITEINRKTSGSTLPTNEVHEQTLDPIPASSHASIPKPKTGLGRLLKSLPSH
jgi:hypothetical protein